MRLEPFQLFVDTMRSGSFAATARERDIDPSSVSRAIAALEADLGLRLFERSTRRFEPTEAGRVLLEYLDPVLADLRLAVERTRDVAARPAGRLRVTASVAYGCEVLTPLLPDLRARYPKLNIELVLSDMPLDIVRERIDVAIRLGPAPGGDLVRARLNRVSHHVCASPAYLDTHGPISSPMDLAARDCVRFPFPGFRSRWLFRSRSGAVTPVEIGGSVLISNAMGLKRCILDGLGPGLLADWMIRAELDNGTLIDVLPDFDVTATDFDTAAWFLYPSRSYMPLKLRVFIDFLREHLGD